MKTSQLPFVSTAYEGFRSELAKAISRAEVSITRGVTDEAQLLADQLTAGAAFIEAAIAAATPETP